MTRDAARSRISEFFVSVRILVVGVFVSVGGMLHSAGTDVRGFQKQLAAAQEQTDKPAIIELSLRIVAARAGGAGMVVQVVALMSDSLG